MITRLAAILLGFLCDLLIGDPDWFPHPIRLIGLLISVLERIVRRSCKTPRALRIGAVVLTVLTVATTMGMTAFVLYLLSLLGPRWSFAGTVFFSWTVLSATSLAREASAVCRALRRGLIEGRKQVSRIVGRDTQDLTESEVLKATIETVAENTTDGVVSPLLYLVLGGPVLAMGFKAASTLDSMVGYLDEHYRDIGWSSARLDDVLNYVPARLTALLMTIAAFILRLDGRNAWRIVLRDHANHLSPNCAWSESAAAGALHVQLGGTHSYFGKPVQKPTIGDDDRPAGPQDVYRTVMLLYGAAIEALLLFSGAAWVAVAISR